jgi:hypothetical protein
MFKSNLNTLQNNKIIEKAAKVKLNIEKSKINILKIIMAIMIKGIIMIDINDIY